MKIETYKEKNLYDKKQKERKYNNITYGVVKEIYSINGTERDAYGIAAYFNAEEDGTATIVLSVNDITSDRDALSDLVEKLNRYDVSPEHIFDILEDFLP